MCNSDALHPDLWVIQFPYAFLEFCWNFDISLPWDFKLCNERDLRNGKRTVDESWDIKMMHPHGKGSEDLICCVCCKDKFCINRGALMTDLSYKSNKMSLCYCTSCVWNTVLSLGHRNHIFYQIFFWNKTYGKCFKLKEIIRLYIVEISLLSGWWGTGTGCQDKLWMCHPWRNPLQHWMALWAAWSGGW